MSACILAIDQGTTSSRAIVFDRAGHAVALAQQTFSQYFPDDAWVEHDPEEIWRVTRHVCKQALSSLPPGEQVVGIGITNQRETTLVWDRATGEPVYPAIVWQDRRTAAHCRRLAEEGKEADIRARTGLLLDPYFSATKLTWILDHVDGVRARAERGELAFGTIDSWLIWKLTEGREHLTDATNASRTLLYNIYDQCWDPTLLELFDIPPALLPEVRDCAADFGVATTGLGRWQLPIAGVAGDQQAAVVGQACFQPGMVKSTYGTGCFALLQLGEQPAESRNRMLTTIAYRLNGRCSYAFEGAIFVAGAAVQWLRDKLGVISSAEETEVLARSRSSNRGVYFVPAFTGLGAPHWNADARGILVGLTRDSDRADIARAALEAVCYQTHDLLNAMADDIGQPLNTLRVDGGMTANSWMLQALADITGVSVERPSMIETSALGAARLAGLQLGLFRDLDHIAETYDREWLYRPDMPAKQRRTLIAGWRKAICKSLEL